MKKIVFTLPALLVMLLSCFDGISGVYDERWGGKGSGIKEYALRDIGPAGGWIFYINPNAADDGWKYLEAAPANIDSPASLLNWKGSQSLTSGTQPGIGTGKANTAALAGISHQAANACRNYELIKDGVIYDDWFLPSRHELDLMCWNLRGKRDTTSDFWEGISDNPDVPNVAGGGVGGFGVNIYWSSSEHPDVSNLYAWLQNFSTGRQDGVFKDYYNYVRAVRAF